MDGRALLEILKRPESAWTSIPVIVFSTSSSREDISASYHAHANAFVTKSMTYDGFQHSFGKIHEFFGSVAVLDREST